MSDIVLKKALTIVMTYRSRHSVASERALQGCVSLAETLSTNVVV